MRNFVRNLLPAKTRTNPIRERVRMAAMNKTREAAGALAGLLAGAVALGVSDAPVVLRPIVLKGRGRLG